MRRQMMRLPDVLSALDRGNTHSIASTRFWSSSFGALIIIVTVGLFLMPVSAQDAYATRVADLRNQGELAERDLDAALAAGCAARDRVILLLDKGEKVARELADAETQMWRVKLAAYRGDLEEANRSIQELSQQEAAIVNEAAVQKSIQSLQEQISAIDAGFDKGTYSRKDHDELTASLRQAIDAHKLEIEHTKRTHFNLDSAKQVIQKAKDRSEVFQKVVGSYITEVAMRRQAYAAHFAAKRAVITWHCGVQPPPPPPKTDPFFKK